MATYQITAPDGNKYRLTGPDNASQQDLINALLTQNPLAGQPPAAPKEGIMAALTGGTKRFGSTLETGLESLINPELAAKRGAARQEEIGQQYAPGASLEKVKQAYEQKGLFPAAYEAVSQIPAALAEQAPQIASAIGGARVGATAGSMFGPTGALVGGIGGAFVPTLTQLYGANLERQAQEKAPEISRSKALGAAIPGAGLEVASTFIPLGRNLIGKLLGPEAEKALARGASEGVEAAAKESLKKSLAKGAGVGALAEVPTEVTQQMLERLQAGLPVTTPDALAEYGEAAYGAAMVGAPFGAAARGFGRPAARAEYEKQLQGEQLKAQQEKDKQAADALKQQEQQLQTTQRNLGVPVTGENVSNVLMLPAPAKEVASEKDPLQDPVGRITEAELGKVPFPEGVGSSQVVNYIKAYRKESNLPPLKTYSLEDIKDAMTAKNPEGEEGALNSILAYKTNYQNETYTPEDIQNRAVAKNVATETKGFSDFLTRATGKSDLNTMTQPELHSVATALDALNRTGKEEQLVLPEGSNATRFTQEQYNAGVTAALLETSKDKPVTYDEALKRVQTQKGIDSDQAAERLLKAAASNDDLVIEKGTGFQAVSRGGVALGTYATEAEAKRNHRRADILPVETQLVRPREEESTEKVAQLPEGYEIQKKTVAGETTPAAYAIREEGSQKNASQTFNVEIDAKRHLELLTRKREALAAAELAKADALRKKLEKQQAAIAQMEAEGNTDTAEHKNAVAAFKAAEVAAGDQITQYTEKAEALRAPLKIVPIGKKTAKVEKHTVIKDGKETGTFTGDKGKTARTKAEEFILSQASDAELQTIADRGGVFGKRAELELDSRAKPGIRRATTEGLEKAGVRTPEVEAKLKELEATLIPMLKKFGLEKVGLNVVRAIENDADGAWGGLNNLIRIAFNAKEPIKTMRHEALHALFDLGFFTPQQWEALKREAKKTWVDKYLKGVAFNDTMSRFEAYTNMGLSDEAILEEAIADAFGSWEGGAKPPPGMMAALFKRLQQFFSALRNALTGAGFESADEIFGKIERGELKAGEKAVTEEEKFAAARPGSDIGHKREASTGRYVGAPDWVGSSPNQLANLRKKLRKLAKEGEPGRHWYERSSQAILDMFGGDKKEAEKFVSLIAIYSPNATVPANTSMALRAYYQYLTGQPIDAGLSAGDKKAEDLLKNNIAWSGIKTNSFYQNLMVAIDPSKLDPGVATMDMWMALAFDYGMKALDQGPKYKFAEREIQNIAKDLGWDAHQVQAAIWTAMKGRVDPIREELKQKELELGIGEMYDDKGKMKYRVKPDRRYDHFRLAHKMGMEYNLTPEAIEASKYDFSDAINQRSAQMSWEATPGATTNLLPGLLKAPMEQKFEYLAAIHDVLTDQNGMDVIAKEIGLPSGKTILGFSAWQGDIGAGAQTFTGVALQESKDKRDVTPEARKLLNLYCAIKGFVLAQEAVVWHVPVYDGAIKNQNGIEGKFNRALTAAEMDKLYMGLHNTFGTYDIAPGYTEDGFRLLNFTDIPNKDFHKGVKELLERLPADFGGGMISAKQYKSVGDYISNDWTNSPQGEDYAEQIKSAGLPNRGGNRPDLQQWAKDLRTRVEAVNQEFSDKYKWGKAKLSDGKYSLRFAESPLRPSPDGGISLGEKQKDATSFVGLHYGQSKVDELSGSKYGTGIRGAERRRLADTDDQRIKKRIYFYIPKEDGTMPRQEAGLGGHVYTQQFDNIAAGPVVDRLFSEAGGDANQFESNVVDAGYDGYAMPNMGMMVILNHNTPVEYHGTMGELAESDKKFSLRTYFPTAEEAEKAAYKAAPPATPEFKRFFGASKVKEEGRPQVMYHGSPNEFDVFRENKPIFISADANEAQTFAKRFGVTSEGIKNTDVNIYPLWVRAETPFDYNNAQHVNRVISWLENELGATTVPVGNGLLKLKDLKQVIKEGNWKAIESEDVQNAFKALGFDSFYVKEYGTKNLAVFSANQVKSVTGNIGEFGENKDIRYSLRKFDRADLPTDKKPFTLPENTMIFHGAHKDAAQKIKDAGRVLLSYPGVKSSSGTLDEGGLIFFGDEETASNYANQKADPMSVKAAIERGETRLPGTVFETVTDRPYRLMNRYHKLTKQQANALTEALGIPDYKRLSAGDDAELAATRAYTNSRVIKRENIPNKGEMASPWPVIFKTLGFDGFYDNRNVPAVVLTADNGIKLIGDDGRLVKYSLPTVSAAAQTRRDETTQQREHKGFIDRILGVFAPESLADLRASFIHRYNQLGVYDKMLADKMGDRVLMADMSAEAAANMSDLSASVTYAAFGIGNRQGGIPVYKNGVTTVDTSTKGPLQILSPLAQFNDPTAYQDYQFWAGVKRGSRFMAEKSATGVVSYREKNFQPTDIALAEEYRKAYLAKGVDFNVIQKEMNTFNDGLVDYMKATSVLAPERAAEFKKHMDYIPFYRQLDGENTVGPKIFNSISGVKPPKKLKGSEAPLTDYLESIVQNTQAAINAGMKNMAAQRAVNVAMQLGKIAGAEKIDGVSSAPDSVTFLENGKAVSYRVADQLFINAVKSLNMSEIPFLGMFSAPSNLLRNLVTKDPGFMLANLARDSLSAWVTSGSNMTPIAGTVANFAKALSGKDPILQALYNAGILGGYEFSSGVMKSAETLEKDLNKKYGSSGKAAPLKVFSGIWDALEKGTEASDAATRMAVYERVLAETGNETEALYRALEVMNFNRKGSSPVVRILTAAIPFLNARVQGLDVFYRTAFGRNVSANAEAMQKAFFVRGATLMALSCAYFLAVSDDDEWKKQEQETKDNYWIAPGIGKFPTPFEVGFLFKTVPERIMAYTLKDDTGQDLMASMQRGLLNTFSFNPIPQIAKPIIEYNANYNFFTGRPIVGQGMEGLEPQYQVGPNTTKVAEIMGKALGMPPIKLDQLINSYTGTMGMYAMSVIDSVLDIQSNSPNASKRFEQLPIIKRFASDPEARGNITQYYELKKAVDAATQTENYLLKAGKPDEFREFMEQNKGLLAIKPYVAEIEKSMKETREMRKMVQGAEMSGDEKGDILTRIGQTENNLTSNIQTVKKMISKLQ
jgi:hypothetical protein